MVITQTRGINLKSASININNSQLEPVKTAEESVFVIDGPDSIYSCREKSSNINSGKYKRE